MKILISAFLLVSLNTIGYSNNALRMINNNSLPIIDNEHSSKVLLYIPSPDEDGDEYVDGDIVLYDNLQKKAKTIESGIINGYYNAWIVNNNKIIIFTSDEIAIYDTLGVKKDNYKFDSTKSLVGADYNERLNKITFLLRDKQKNKVQLYLLDIRNSEMKLIIPDLKLDFDDEQPFLDMRYYNNNNVWVEKYCRLFYQIDLTTKNVTEISIVNVSCDDIRNSFNDSFLLSLYYVSDNKAEYKLVKRNLSSAESTVIINGKNKFNQEVNLDLYGDIKSPGFLLKVDNSLLLVTNSKAIKIQLPINCETILKYENNNIYYLDKKNKIHYKDTRTLVRG